MADELRIKRGATLSLNLAFTDETGAPVDLSTATLSAQLRDSSDTLVATLPVAPEAGMPGQAEIRVDATAAWPLGRLRCDISLVQDGVTAFSDTFDLVVERPVTQPAQAAATP